MAFTLNQHLIPLDVSADINESLEAPVADPLWTLSRQLLMGEFEAEAGGRPVQLESTWTVSPISRARIGEQTVDLEPGRPMESVVEAEGNASSSPAWNSEDLEYRFSVEAGNDQLNARDYEGRDLDWYHFERTEAPEPAPGEATELVQRSIPRRLTLRGLPHPSFWRFEEGGVAFVPERDPMPNALSVLLPEFAFLDANDWFVVPLEGVAGAVQRVRSVRMVDSFGHVTDLAAGIGRQPGDVWRVFTIDHAEGTANADGALLLCPDIAANAQQGAILEEVLFVRDEAANQVWAVELAYQDSSTGLRVDRRDEEAGRIAPPSSAAASATNMARYRLRSELAAHWIPYIARRMRPADPDDAQIYFRRGRTLPEATQAQPQYRTRLVAESWRLREESLPPTGLRVQRLWRFARCSDGTGLFWVARRKHFSPQEHSAGIDFDYLE